MGQPTDPPLIWALLAGIPSHPLPPARGEPMKLREFVLVLFAFLLAGCAPATGGPLATEVAVQATIFAPSPTPLQPVPPTATPVPGPEATSFVLLGLDSDPAHPERNAYGIRTAVFGV